MTWIRLPSAPCGFALFMMLGLPLSAQSGESRPAKGKIAYLRQCAACHGKSGRGDGPQAALLSEHPPDLRDDSALRSYSNQDIAALVLTGRALRLELRPQLLQEHAANTESLYSFMRRLPDIEWEPVEAGRDVYFDRCLDCHDRYGHPAESLPTGARKPRDLADKGFQASASDAELNVLIRHGKKGMPVVLPRPSEEETRQIAAFIRLLSSGYELYDRYCFACHGSRGEGTGGPLGDLSAATFAFDRAYFRKTPEEQVKKAIWHMLRDRKPAMPHFSTSLTAPELDAILDYLRTLPAEPKANPVRP